MTFAISADPNMPLEELRAEGRELYGLDVHIHAKIGPVTFNSEERILTIPFELIDSEFLIGEYGSELPLDGHCLYVGHFIELKMPLDS